MSFCLDCGKKFDFPPYRVGRCDACRKKFADEVLEEVKGD